MSIKLWILSGAFAALATVSHAQNSESSPRQFTAQAGEIVLETQNLMGENQYSAALAKLSEVLKLPDLNAYELSIIYQMQGSSYYELDQFGPAITAFEKAIASGGLLPKEAANMQAQIAQLMIANGQYAQGAQKLEDYLKAGGQLKSAYINMLTQAWIQAKNYNKALPWAEKSFAAANPKERKDYNTLNYLYSQLKLADRQAELVKEMIGRWPQERELWEAWASLLSQSGQDEDAFEVNKLQYLAGVLTEETDIMKVVQYYSFYDMPYQAAQILEKELNAGRVKRQTDKLVQLSSLYRQAREYGRAIPILEAAVQSGGSAELHAQLGEALYNEGECARAEKAFKRAINGGYDAGKAWTLIATCRYEDVQRQEKLNCKMKPEELANAPKTKARQSTIAAFENVPSNSKESRDAKKWISFIKSERLTFDKRCEFEERVRKEACFKDIRRAYEGFFTNGEFTLGNPDCMVYKAEYDKEYRREEAG